MNTKHLLVILTLFILCFSCKTANKKAIKKEGFVAVEGGKIWYKIVGDGKGIPLLVLHGGPGSKSCGTMPTYSLMGNERPIIFYDQLGSGNSERPTDTTLWRAERFADEINHLRKALNLKKVHIIGQSWGGALLAEYMATKNTKGVKSVIFSSPLISTPMWIEDANLLVSQLPSHIKDTIKKYEALKDYRAKEYLKATDSFYARHLTRRPWPRKKAKACENYGSSNRFIYNYMWGPTEFNATGTLKHFDRTADLKNITPPILFMAGEFDEARPETMYKFQKMVPHSKVEIIKDAAHATANDQPEQVIQVLNSFLKSVEQND